MPQAQANPGTRLLARVHCLKRDRGLDHDAWREMLRVGWCVESSALLSIDQLDDLARRLEGKGNKPAYPGRPRNMGPQRPRGAKRKAATEDTRAAQLQKIEAFLTEAGRPWNYADGLAARICKTSKIEWVATDQLYKIITALHKDAERHGRPTE